GMSCGLYAGLRPQKGHSLRSRPRGFLVRRDASLANLPSHVPVILSVLPAEKLLRMPARNENVSAAALTRTGFDRQMVRSSSRAASRAVTERGLKAGPEPTSNFVRQDPARVTVSC